MADQPSTLPESSDTPDQKKRPTPEEGEKKVVSCLLDEIKRAKELRKDFDETELPKLRRLVWGVSQNKDTGTAGAVADTRSNLVYSSIATLVPNVYAKNPEIGCSVKKSVAPAEYEKWKKFGETSESLLQEMVIEETRLKEKMKSAVRGAMAESIGWLKMTWQEAIDRDPLIVQRVADSQDNLANIQRLLDEVSDPDERNEYEKNVEELKQSIAALEAQSEVRHIKAFALDRIAYEDLFVLDESVVEFHEYVNARKIAHRVWMTCDEYEAAFGYEPSEKAVTYQSTSTGEKRSPSNAEASYAPQFLPVYEVWDIDQKRVYTVCEGEEGYCRAPYTPDYTPARWHPFYGLAFNPVPGRFRPLSDVELIAHLEAEYNQTRYLFAEARKESIPVRAFRKAGGLTEEDIKNLQNRKARDWIGVEGNPQVPLNQDVVQFDGIRLDPAAYDVTLIRNDIDMMLGISDASRANLIEAKTATEANIMQQSLQSRVAERRDCIEDLISEMGHDALEIALRKLSHPEVQQIVGEDSEWPSMPIEQIFYKVRVAVKAGSSGKPDMQMEREQWANLMPIIAETAKRVAELRMAGQFDLADSQIELLKETLRRYDERIDVDKFVPRQELDEQGNPIQQNQMMQQGQQAMQENAQLKEAMGKMQEEMQALQQENEQLKQGLVQKDEAHQREIEFKREQAEADRQLEFDKAVMQEESRKEIEKYKADRSVETANAKLAQDGELEEKRIEQGAKPQVAMQVDGKEELTGMHESVRSTMEGMSATHQQMMEALMQTMQANQQQMGAALTALTEASKAMTQAVTTMADTAGMDVVPVRGADGSIERMTRKRPGMTQ